MLARYGGAQTHPHAYELARRIQRQYAKTLAGLQLRSRSAIEEYYRVDTF